KTAIIAMIGAIFIITFINLIKNIFSSGFRVNLRKLPKLLLSVLIITFVFVIGSEQITESFNVNFSEINRLDDLLTGNMSEATTGRTEIWRTGLAEGNSFIGTGFMTYRDVVNAPAHNIYISTFVEAGLIGLLLIITYFIILLITVGKLRKYKKEN